MKDHILSSLYLCKFDTIFIRNDKIVERGGGGANIERIKRYKLQGIK